MSHNCLAVWLTRGRSFSWVIPVTSLLKSDTPPRTLSMGNTASVNRMIPIPPIHCIIERQNTTPCGICSSPVSTVAPVVVKPAIVSKKASVTLSIAPLSKNGNMPKSEKNTHTTAVSRSPSRLRIDWLVGLIKSVIIIPDSTVIVALTPNDTATRVSP